MTLLSAPYDVSSLSGKQFSILALHVTSAASLGSSSLLHKQVVGQDSLSGFCEPCWCNIPESTEANEVLNSYCFFSSLVLSLHSNGQPQIPTAYGYDAASVGWNV